MCALITVAAAPAASANSKYAAIVIDANTGKTLFSRHADAPRYPASLTKIMTLYILFEEMKAGRMNMGTRLKVSRHASAQAPSKLGLKPGSTIKVRDAMMALITKSANDVAAVVAENISGSETRFAKRMTSTARRLGMRNTTFRNASGLPNRAQRTTARDMATLGRAVQQHFPKEYSYFKTRVFKYRGRRYGNHNRLLGRVKGVDGIKTGYTRASGFNLVSSVRRDKRHIVAVVMGGRTGRSRNAHMTKLIRTYLPKASRSNLSPKAVIARGNSPAFRIAIPKNAPPPPLKPDEEIVTAAIPLVPVKPAARTVRVKTTALRAPSLPDRKAKKVRVQSISIGTHDTPDQGPRPTGWQIQIAALPTNDEALALIGRARRAHDSLLSERKSYTMKVETGNGTLYRARFAGFGSKSAAKSACSSLKRKKFACYPLYE
ncbi:D-alanyl-D-alanine carboxypeptidase [Rhodobium gokarnense]|uniref:D-alanyl-D-alanine carboxypeptidase n=1 Tax=Rhodobium gokarnense TaxID=364296 RepID=A0ABT3HA22_9HYPH|nr:D-alanyl-D-alanine carboxypeptidase [Rhodobium gokarnense]MCW2307252.1 D-alanyl-D-alanine carboxypeptidase [Rhodobium gokarnense]